MCLTYCSGSFEYSDKNGKQKQFFELLKFYEEIYLQFLAQKKSLWWDPIFFWKTSLIILCNSLNINV
jgi:hypothetical protein